MSGEPGADVTSKILLSGGCVLTLGAKTPNFTRADVLIDDGVVAEVGTGLRARDAEQVDATDTIVMPGFVDTHRHAWTSLFRNLGDVAAGRRERREASATRFRPEDVYAATLIGLLGAIEAGITTVVDWSPIRPDDGLADAALQAHADAGLRTVFVHAARTGTEEQGSTAPAIRRARGAPRPTPPGRSTTIAFGSDVPGANDLERVAAEWAWPVSSGCGSTHTSTRKPPGPERSPSSPGAASWVRTSRSCTARRSTTRTSRRSPSSGASVSLAPSSEMAGGLGTPPIQSLIDRDIRPGPRDRRRAADAG